MNSFSLYLPYFPFFRFMPRRKLISTKVHVLASSYRRSRSENRETMLVKSTHPFLSPVFIDEQKKMRKLTCLRICVDDEGNFYIIVLPFSLSLISLLKAFNIQREREPQWYNHFIHCSLSQPLLPWSFWRKQKRGSVAEEQICRKAFC